MRRFLFLFALGIGVFFMPTKTFADTTGCCLTSENICLDEAYYNPQTKVCRLLLSPAAAGYPAQTFTEGKSCADVAPCNLPGACKWKNFGDKCESPTAPGSGLGIKYKCDAKDPVLYSFFANQECPASKIPGSCCDIFNSKAPDDCYDNATELFCSKQADHKYYKDSACSSVSRCDQAKIGSPMKLTPQKFCCVKYPPAVVADQTPLTCNERDAADSCSTDFSSINTDCTAVPGCLGNAQSVPTSPTGTTTSTMEVPNKTTPLTYTVEPQVALPLFNGTITISPTTITDYLKAVFVYFVGVIFLVAVAMVTYGGVRWVTARGSSSNISEAKDIIYKALIGVVIALTAVLLLNVISPNLVNLKSIDPKYVSGVPLALMETDQAPLPDGATATLSQVDLTACTVSKTSHHPAQTIKPEDKCFVGGPVFSTPVTNTYVSSPLGQRRDPKLLDCHPGVDFSTGRKDGVPILAVTGGMIKVEPKYCGEYVVDIFSSGYFVRYLHLSALSVSPNDVVKAGQEIGKSGGDTGTCKYTPHAHVELYALDGTLHDVSACIPGMKSK